MNLDAMKRDRLNKIDDQLLGSLWSWLLIQKQRLNYVLYSSPKMIFWTRATDWFWEKDIYTILGDEITTDLRRLYCANKRQNRKKRFTLKQLKRHGLKWQWYLLQMAIWQSWVIYCRGHRFSIMNDIKEAWNISIMILIRPCYVGQISNIEKN